MIESSIIPDEVGEILNIAFKRRTAVDYHDFVTVTKEEIMGYHKKMKDFVFAVDDLIQIRLKDQSLE
jgi:uncharacterized protein (UPF0332 family)